jgi:cytidylate kinase
MIKAKIKNYGYLLKNVIVDSQKEIMKSNKISVEKFIKDQLRKWESMYSQEDKKYEVQIPVITVSGEPGSKGSIVAEGIARRLEFDLFNRDIIKEISKSVKMSTAVIETLEKERLSGVEDFISSLVRDQYLHPDLYLEHLMKVVSTIGKHGRAVIVGRGANFILPSESRFSVRVVAPFEVRVQNIANMFGTSLELAKQRVIRRESRRRAFIRHSFNADVRDPLNYDLAINTGKLNTEAAVEAVIGAIIGCQGEK